MSSLLLIYVAAKGWLRYLPKRWRLPLSRRTLRAIMAAQGVPLDGLSDSAMDAGVNRLADLTDSRDLALAASLRDLMRDELP